VEEERGKGGEERVRKGKGGTPFANSCICPWGFKVKKSSFIMYHNTSNFTSSLEIVLIVNATLGRRDLDANDKHKVSAITMSFQIHQNSNI